MVNRRKTLTPSDVAKKTEKALTKIRGVKEGRDPAMDFFPDNWKELLTHRSKLHDLDLVSDLLKAKRIGMSDSKACETVGISKYTLYEWLRAGTEELELRDSGQGENEDRTPYLIFLAAYMDAKHDPVRRALELVQYDIDENRNVDTARWLLERAAPEDFARVSRVDIHNMYKGGKISERIAALPAPQAKQLEGLNIIEGEFEIVDDDDENDE